MQTIHPLRVLIKAILLLLAVDLLFGLFNPPVQKLSLYNSLFPGRLRFPFGVGAQDYDLTLDEADALFAAHVISAGPKPSDELRVVVLGDSSVWGEQLAARETLPAQLDGAGLACGSRRMRVYNLGYPHPFALKDLVILQRAMQYQPDAIVWMLTLNAFRFKGPNPFLAVNSAETISVVKDYGLAYDVAPLLKSPAPSFWDETLIGQRNRLARLALEQWFGFFWWAGVEKTSAAGQAAPLRNNVGRKTSFAGVKPPGDLSGVTMFELLDAGRSLAGKIPLLLVNEPMFIATGKNSNVRYNSFYPRWAYDEYRQTMSDRVAAHGWNYVDLWDALPGRLFTDTPLHLSPAGEAQLAGLLAPHLLAAACTTSP